MSNIKLGPVSIAFKKRLITITGILFIILSSVLSDDTILYSPLIRSDYNESISKLYNQLSPEEIKPSYKVFYGGMVGYYRMIQENRLENQQFLTLIDFSLSSKLCKLWVIDIESMQIVHHSYVSHGKNSGGEYAIKFSNTPKTNMSSLGFYITGFTYQGKYGLSLLLDGIEPGINDNARKRAIVIHSAPYATQSFINKYGRLGRSFGCPALPSAKSTAIIETIKNRSCLFIYYPDRSYLVKSHYLNSI